MANFHPFEKILTDLDDLVEVCLQIVTKWFTQGILLLSLLYFISFTFIIRSEVLYMVIHDYR